MDTATFTRLRSSSTSSTVPVKEVKEGGKEVAAAGGRSFQVLVCRYEVG